MQVKSKVVCQREQQEKTEKSGKQDTSVHIMIHRKSRIGIHAKKRQL